MIAFRESARHFKVIVTRPTYRWARRQGTGCEGISTNAMFKSAYRSRRALMPIDGFFEWKATKGEAVKQPYAIAMKDGSPFAVA